MSSDQEPETVSGESHEEKEIKDNQRTPVRVLQVLPSLSNYGGVERYILDVACVFSQENRPFWVACEAGPLSRKAKEHGAVIEEGCFSSKSLFRLVLNALKLVRLIKKHRIDLVHVHSRAPAWSVWMASLLTRVPFVATYHGTYDSQFFLKRFYNGVMCRGTFVICISQFIKKHIETIYPSCSQKSILISEGVDTTFFTPSFMRNEDLNHYRNQLHLSKGARVLLLPSRLTSWKGQMTFLRAAALLNGQFSNQLVFLCVGSEGKNKDYLESLRTFARQKIQHKVIFMPPVFDIRPFYALSEIVLSCSLRGEAFGRTTAEALSSGCLFIGTNIGATPELCIHHQTGFLVPPSDEKALAKRIDSCLRLSNHERTEIQQQARSHIESSFSLEFMCKELISFYEKFKKGS